MNRPSNAEADPESGAKRPAFRRWGLELRPVWLFLLGTMTTLPVLAWALARDGVLGPGTIAHAALMLAAWGVLIPAGGLLARYGKVRRGQGFPNVVHDLFWWRGHRVLQYAGIGLAAAALAAVLAEAGPDLGTLHARCGAAVMALGWAQVASGWLRGTAGGPWGASADPRDPATWRGDHYDMTRRRRLFEAWHRTAGWGAVALAGVTIPLGVGLAGAPAWLTLLVGVLQGAVALGFVDGIARGRRVATYRALWGTDPPHPGLGRRSRVRR